MLDMQSCPIQGFLCNYLRLTEFVVDPYQVIGLAELIHASAPVEWLIWRCFEPLIKLFL